MLARAVHRLTCPVKAFTTLTVMSPRRLFGAILLLFIISTASLERNPSEGDRFNHPRGDFARSTGVTNFRPHFHNFGEHGVARNESTQRSPYPSFHQGIKSGIGDRTQREPAGKLSGDTNTNKWQDKKYNRESTDKPVVKRAAFAWPERQPFDLRMERRLHPHPRFGHFRNEAIYHFRGPAFHAFEANRMRPDVRGGGPFEEAQIWKWHLGFRGPDTGKEMRKIPVKGEKDEVEEGRVQEPVERKEERKSVQRDVEGSRTWQESREPRGDSPVPSHEDRADEQSQEHYSKLLHSWTTPSDRIKTVPSSLRLYPDTHLRRPTEESEVRKWHDGVINQHDEENRSGDLGHRASEGRRAEMARERKEEPETIGTDFGETHVWEGPEEPIGKQADRPRGDLGQPRDWRPTEESEVRKWHDGVVNQDEEETRGRDVGSRASEARRDVNAKEKEMKPETIRTDVGETRVWEKPEEPSGRNEARPPHGGFGPIREWRPTEESEVRKWHDGVLNQHEEENRGRDGGRRVIEGGGDGKVKEREEKTETMRMDVGKTRVWETPEEPSGRNEARLPHGGFGPIREWSEDSAARQGPNKADDNARTSKQNVPDEEISHELRDVQLDRNVFRQDRPEGPKEQKPELFDPGMRPYLERHPPTAFLRDPLQPPHLRPRIPDAFNPGNMDWFRQSLPTRLEFGRRPGERQESRTSALRSSGEQPPQNFAETEDKTPQEEKKKPKLIVGPAGQEHAQPMLKVRFVAGGPPMATTPVTTSLPPQKATEATAEPIDRSRQSLVLPARAGEDNAQSSASKPQAQVVLNVFQDKHGKLNFELAPDHVSRWRGEKTGVGDEEDEEKEDESEKDREINERGESSRRPEQYKSLVEKTSIAGEFPSYPHGLYPPHLHAKRMLLPPEAQSHAPPLYSASFAGEHFDRFGQSHSAPPDLNNRLGRIHPHEDAAKKPKSERATYTPLALHEAPATTTPAVVTPIVKANKTAVSGSGKVDKASFSQMFDHLEDDNSFLEKCYQNNCTNQCPGGVYKLSPATGCLTCDCCEEVTCYQYCEHGYEADEEGCPVCECAQTLEDGGFLL